MKNSYPKDALYDGNSEILILGSYPNVKSLDSRFYYSDKRNRFWNLLSDIYKENIPEDNKGKEAFLKKHHIALWDVCADVEKPEPDKTLKDKKPNKLEKVFPPHSKIKKILCNGKKSHDLLRKYYKDLEGEYIISSSGGANRYSEERKKQWKEALLGKK